MVEMMMLAAVEADLAVDVEACKEPTFSRSSAPNFCSTIY